MCTNKAASATNRVGAGAGVRARVNERQLADQRSKKSMTRLIMETRAYSKTEQPQRGVAIERSTRAIQWNSCKRLGRSGLKLGE
eukprot:6197157-Pleurochrysis_carterae.AAC.2